MDIESIIPKATKIIINGVEGVWSAIPHRITNEALYQPPSYPITIRFPDSNIPPIKLTNSGDGKIAKKGYPDLFEKFWSEYHPDRRVGKRETFAEWKKITPPERLMLPAAAAHYAAEAQLQGTNPKYLKHPVRFISTGLFEDYAEKEVNMSAIQAVEFWNMQFQASMGVPYPWKEDDRFNLDLDVRALGASAWKDKVWYFFAGNDQKVKDATKELGAHYNTFRHLLTGPLAYSGLKRKAACPHCGEHGGHAFNCPTAIARRNEKAKAMAEIEAGKTEGAAALSSLKGRLKGGNQ